MYSVISKSYRNKLVNAEKNNSYYIGDFNTKGIASSYDQLLANVQNRISRVSNLQEIDLNSKPTLSGKLCDTNCADKFYYLHTDKDLTVNGFECNGKGIITVGGNLIINPDIKNINANRDACVFLVKKNVNIKSGDYHSASKLGYDQVNAFIIADGQITLENDLGASGSRKDGLKINGSLISFNSNPIKIERFLGYSDKQFYPSVVLEAHEKYGAVLKLAFGSRIEIIKTEVGYKPF